ncbi:MAG: ATP-binding protein [Planctomycetaceae bacterium]
MTAAPGNPSTTSRTAATDVAELASLAGGLAHEIRNPLSVFNLNVELLIEDFENPESPRDRRALQRLKLLEKECQHLERILNDFLEFVRAGSLALETTDLNDVVRELAEYFQPQFQEARIEISPHLGGNLPGVQLDRRLFRQALINLVQNARQAMPNGGVLELQTYLQDDRVVLEVIDTGQGMDERTQAKMFDAFYSTKQNGSGLGLPTVRRIVESHGGTIACASEPGRGTRFTIALPPASLTSPQHE